MFDTFTHKALSAYIGCKKKKQTMSETLSSIGKPKKFQKK